MKLALAFISAVLAAPHCAPTLSGSPAVAQSKLILSIWTDLSTDCLIQREIKITELEIREFHIIWAEIPKMEVHKKLSRIGNSALVRDFQ